MSPSDTGKAMAPPPAHEWAATERGITRWRAFVTSVTVDRLAGPAQERVLTVSEDGRIVAVASLSAEQAAHLAKLLAPSAEAAA